MDNYNKLKHFFDTREVAHKATEPLSNYQK